MSKLSEIENTEKVFEGVVVAPGIAIGPVHLYSREGFEAEREVVQDDEVESEVQRFISAIERSERDVRKIEAVALEKIGQESSSIFEAQLLMLRDPSFFDEVIENISTDKHTADFAVQFVMSHHRHRMELSQSKYIRERAEDMADVQHRIIRHLQDRKGYSKIELHSIVVADYLTAADVILFSRRNMLGFALDFGGKTSHVSITARSLGIPAIVGTHNLSQMVTHGDVIIIDGPGKKVITNPSSETIDRYERLASEHQDSVEAGKAIIPLPSTTLDGTNIVLLSNISATGDIAQTITYGLEGVGLLRTEMFFLGRSRFPDEDMQVRAYKSLLSDLEGRPVTIRLLDIGGDKMLPMGHREKNPFLGWRGIRVLLERQELLIPQIRAILRASAHGPVKLLVPFVTNVGEIRETLAVLNRCKEELRGEAIDFDEDLPFGMMLEVPSACLMVKKFTPYVDFFSLGTNDLTQYVLAVDRGNDLVSGIYRSLHPALLQLVKYSVESAKEAGKDISICGEMAGSVEAVAILIGLGIENLSMAPVCLPDVKRVLRSLDKKEAIQLAEKSLECVDSDSIYKLTEDWLTEKGIY